MSPILPVTNPPAERILDADDEFIERNLKELQEKKSREERKANGRLAAVIVALLLVFLALYHAWIRNTGALAGVLVPALIMILYGGWVVFLAKRDKKNRQMYEKHMEEAARKHLLAKIELGRKKRRKGDGNDGVKKKSKKSSKCKDSTTKEVGDNDVSDLQKSTILKIENHKTPCKIETATEQTQQTLTLPSASSKINKTKKDATSSNSSKSNSKSNNKSSHSHHNATKDGRSKRPSFRQKLFRQNATEMSIFKNKKLKRLDALSAPPPLSRTTSAP